jgi:hypothetical protein
MPLPLRSPLARAFTVALLLGPTASLSAQASGTPEMVHYIRVDAIDYAFNTVTSVEEGIVTFHLVDKGADVHQMSVLELGVGHTVKEFFEVMRTTGAPPAWAPAVGATPTIQPNSEAFLTLRLAPGKYILGCLIPARDGRSHVAKGMYQLLTVTAKPGAGPATKKPTG